MLIRNATLPDGRTGVDLLAVDGRIAAVGPQLPAPEGVEVVDAGAGCSARRSSTRTSTWTRR